MIPNPYLLHIYMYVHSLIFIFSLKKKAFSRGKVKFYPWGLYGKNEKINSKGWEMKTLGTIVKDLGHENVSELLYLCA